MAFADFQANKCGDAGAFRLEQLADGDVSILDERLTGSE